MPVQSEIEEKIAVVRRDLRRAALASLFAVFVFMLKSKVWPSESGMNLSGLSEIELAWLGISSLVVCLFLGQAWKHRFDGFLPNKMLPPLFLSFSFLAFTCFCFVLYWAVDVMKYD